ncbi:NTP transferase domain-containing protein [Pelotomaculum terephthalicicum JT]|uniref:mannose-1-phosphate guanylyltransferase n=1 Tax=Pelotomaculum terephthalicicum TaxID=206393 RepID=UPI001F0369B0|nr:sugar phosphate nucleotidyltransferase [Pelotomaculum terephthalicicum]MCG9968547.1 NTP transferase domain-containing protein [Pelotomaculum terephthalicicum JT]
MACVVIMAGGRGERFWPRSRMALPKQFLNLIENKTMLQQTVERVQGLVNMEDIYVVAGAEFKDIIIKQIPQIPQSNIIVEPFGRDTAAAVGLAALVVRQKNPFDVMIVLPADHYINDVPRFKDIIKGAIAAAGRGENIITLGIAPHRPETGYGYICQGEQFDEFAGIKAYVVDKFLEKPNYAQALEFLFQGNYLWNSGMFVWRVDLISALIEIHIPELAEGLRIIERTMGMEQYDDTLREVYNGLPKISVDYGILERTERVLVIRGDFGWDDLGSWTALDRYAKKDKSGNALEGNGVFLETKDTYVYSPDNIVAVIGVEDLIVVCENDSLLVCHKDKAQDIKKAVQALKDNGFEDVL